MSLLLHRLDRALALVTDAVCARSDLYGGGAAFAAHWLGADGADVLLVGEDTILALAQRANLCRGREREREKEREKLERGNR